MRMSISTWSIKNPIPPILLFLVLTVAGIYAYIQLPINNMPSIVVPLVSTSVSQPGASAEELESQVTRLVESAVSGLQGVKHVNSTIVEGVSTTVVEFNLEVPFDRAVSDVRDSIAAIQDKFPKTTQTPIVKRIDVDSGTLSVYTVEAPEMRLDDLSWFIDDTLTREMLSVPGMAEVKRQGGVDNEVTITLDPIKLQALGVTAASISRSLALTNIDLPGGMLRVSGTEYTLRTLGNAKTIEALKDIRLPLAGNRYVRLGDLGHISMGSEDIRNISRLEGKPVVTMTLYRNKKASDIQVSEAIKEKIQGLKKEYPGVSITEIFSIVPVTKRNFDSTMMNFFEGALLTIMVVFFFLRDSRATFIAAVAIPLSVIPTFLFLYLFDYSLNAVSLLGISLVTGVLVDDAIVEIENIHRHMREGKTPYVAAMEAADEIGLAVVATTMVICAVFLPVSFMAGIPGQYFRQFGLTVAVAAFFSLVVARTLTPMLAAYLLKFPEHEDKQDGFFYRTYHQLLEWTLTHRLKTMAMAFGSMVFSLSLIPFLSTGFIPAEDLAQSSLSIELPSGSTLEETDAMAQKVGDIIRQNKEVLYVMTTVGGSAVSTGRPRSSRGSSKGINVANLQIKLTPKKERSLSQAQFENKILPALKQIPDVKINFSNSSGGKDISVALVGDDGKLLEETAQAIEKEMRNIPVISSVSSSSAQRQPEIIITPNYAKAAELGITVEAISEAVRVATIGDLEANLAKFNYGSRQIPITVHLPSRQEQSLEMLKNIKLPTSTGNSVPLSAITSLDFATGPNTIERYDRRRNIFLQANLNGVSLGDAMIEVYKSPTLKNLPPGIAVRNTGDASIMKELFASFAIAIIAGLLMVYSIQVLLYRDWLQPFSRMAALPLSIGGAFILLLITNTDLSMPAIIGVLMLMGIADKNSILLVDYMLELIQRGVPRREAIIKAAMVRARPIVMTSIAMMAGMMPIALKIGTDSEFRSPMAIAVIGGLVSSTALSLIFVPVIFSYVRQFEDWLTKKISRYIHINDQI
ncbi:MAG: efflux RND transporter permease subunit [Alphaproteobacteria bacterium]|nr:efflux RND transporter permease subunit [Alphaproteobacteria bacterium]